MGLNVEKTEEILPIADEEDGDCGIGSFNLISALIIHFHLLLV